MYWLAFDGAAGAMQVTKVKVAGLMAIGGWGVEVNRPGFGRDSLLGSGDQAGQVA
jgi:hypothetical protein